MDLFSNITDGEELEEFYEYVQAYWGSTRPLNYSHLVKGCLLEFGSQVALKILEYHYKSATAVGEGEDITVTALAFPIPIECKNEKYHTETPQSTQSKVLSRFRKYHKNYPKLLLRAPVHYTDKARRMLDDNNVQVIELSKDINTLDELARMMSEITAKLRTAFYKFVSYERYRAKEQHDAGKSGQVTPAHYAAQARIEEQGVAIGFVNKKKKDCEADYKNSETALGNQSVNLIHQKSDSQDYPNSTFGHVQDQQQHLLTTYSAAYLVSCACNGPSHNEKALRHRLLSSLAAFFRNFLHLHRPFARRIEECLRTLTCVMDFLQGKHAKLASTTYGQNSLWDLTTNTALSNSDMSRSYRQTSGSQSDFLTGYTTPVRRSSFENSSFIRKGEAR